MTTFSIFRYFFHLSQELLGYKLSCVHVEMATGYIPKQSLTFEFLFLVFLFFSLFFFFGGLWRTSAGASGSKTHPQQPDQKENHGRLSLSFYSVFFLL